MKNSGNTVVPHPYFLDLLFAFKSKISVVFRDVLGIHELAHIAITQITPDNQLLTLSSTPALDFNLFQSSLWRYDKTFDPAWFNLHTHSLWQDLYHPTRYDELYYLKQIKHRYTLGLSLAEQTTQHTLIYSLASHKNCAHTQELFITKQDDFYKIGHYCFNLLEPLFHLSEQWQPKTLLVGD